MYAVLPKEFIQTVILGDLKNVTKTSAYLSFALMAISIEFLGKCLDDTQETWYDDVDAAISFDLAFKTFKSLNKYKDIGTKNFLYNSLRNGMIHSLIPKPTNKWHIGFTHGENKLHLISAGHKHLILVCDNLYNDIVIAYTELIEMIDKGEVFRKDGKMYKPIIAV